MKRFILISMMLALVLTVNSQSSSDTVKKKDKEMITIFGNDITHGGYGGISINQSKFDDQDALLMGIKGGWVINHSFVLGIGGYGFVNDIYMDNIIDEEGYNLSGGYGGLLLEPIIAPKWPVHLSLPIIVGAGGISYIEKYLIQKNDPDDEEWENRPVDSDAFFVFEPGVELEFNFFKFMRLSFGIYYRFTDNIDIKNTKQDVLEGMSIGGSMKFGKF